MTGGSSGSAKAVNPLVIHAGSYKTFGPMARTVMVIARQPFSVIPESVMPYATALGAPWRRLTMKSTTATTTAATPITDTTPCTPAHHGSARKSPRSFHMLHILGGLA